MFRIEKTDFGFHITLSGTIRADEMIVLYEKIISELPETPQQEIKVYVDIRNLEILDDWARRFLVEGQAVCKRKGMVRSVVIYNDPEITKQIKQMAKHSRIDAFERYLDASTIKDFEQVGMAWLLEGKDPDKEN